MSERTGIQEAPWDRALELLLKGLGHLTATLLIAGVMMCIFVPPEGALEIVRISFETPQLRGESLRSFGLLLGFSLSLWVVAYSAWLLARDHAEKRKLKTVKLSMGTVMTETLIIMPIFLLLSFGLAQLSINMIAGILANVAGWSATRAVWMWEPEANAGRMGVTEDIAKDHARVAAAMVMTPVASGEYINPGVLFGGSQDLSDAGGLMRSAVVKGQIGFTNNFLERGASTGTNSELTMWAALGGNQNFVIQSVRKFSRAFQCTTVDIVRDGDNIGASFSYELFLGMPFVGSVMAGNGFFKLPDAPAAKNGYRPGYYRTYTRQYMLPAQKAKVNSNLPSNAAPGGGLPSTPSQSDGINNGANSNQ